MARELVDLYHGAGAGAEAESRFDLVHKEHAIPDDVEETAIPERRRPRGKGLAPAPAGRHRPGRVERGGTSER